MVALDFEVSDGEQKEEKNTTETGSSGETNLRKWSVKLPEKSLAEEKTIGVDWTDDELLLSPRNKIHNSEDAYTDNRSFKEKRELRLKAEVVRRKAIKHISSEAYLKKLMIEFDNDVEKAKAEQQKRIDNVESVVIHPYEKLGGKQDKLFIEEYLKTQKIPKTEEILSEDNIKQGFQMINQVEGGKEYLNSLGIFSEEDFIKKILSSKDVQEIFVQSVQNAIRNRLKKNIQDEMNKMDGYYNVLNHSISIRPLVDFENALYHELMHASTRFEKRITDKTKKTLDSSIKNTFKQTIFSPNTSDKVLVGYLKNASERLVRKQQLDKQLEELKIKKYGEEFTREHYNALMKAYDNGKFSEDANQFIETTEKDFKAYKEIFDTIADNESQDNQNEMIG